MTNATSPIVTVLMPVYNGEHYLSDAIESILNQTFTEFEFLIIDDGSSDKSLEIIKSYSDPRIRIVQHTENSGLISTLNEGIELASGKYIARMDCDDVSMPERLQKQYDFIELNTDVSVVGSWAWAIDAMGNITGEIKTLSRVSTAAAELFFTNPMIHSSTFFNRQFVLSIGGYNINFERAEDYYLWINVVKNKGKILNLPIFLLKYRDHTSNVSNTFSDRQEAVARKAIQYAYSSLINYALSIKRIALLRDFCLHPNIPHERLDKLKAILLLRQLRKIFMSQFKANQEAMEYLQSRISSIALCCVSSKINKILINIIL